MPGLQKTQGRGNEGTPRNFSLDVSIWASTHSEVTYQVANPRSKHSTSYRAEYSVFTS